MDFKIWVEILWQQGGRGKKTNFLNRKKSSCEQSENMLPITNVEEFSMAGVCLTWISVILRRIIATVANTNYLVDMYVLGMLCHLILTIKLWGMLSESYR